MTGSRAERAEHRHRAGLAVMAVSVALLVAPALFSGVYLLVVSSSALFYPWSGLAAAIVVLVAAAWGVRATRRLVGRIPGLAAVGGLLVTTAALACLFAIQVTRFIHMEDGL